MSYDLMVFAPEAAPHKRDAFLDWYDQQTEWHDDQDYDDPAIATAALQAFFAELSAEFAPAEGDGDTGTDYTIGPSLIYLSFLDWDKIDRAHEAVFSLAGKHGLGFFDVSSDLAEAWLPDKKGGLRVAHSD
ncbi:hypothetical protein [Massilia soli]|uniref:DUF695 domain-containing protein n=1 Tax=Massilia soli TaxID=2792854 RepID=A0ABS7SU96_9BURK|nr:hypothetical protein [Massilia soli]MBZ2209533.1 hypothetical protein [Massilia soli]